MLDEIAFNGCSDLNRVAGGSLTVLIYTRFWIQLRDLMMSLCIGL